jgi:hypothetical protein
VIGHIVTVIGHRLDEFFHAGPAWVIGINRTVPFVVPSLFSGDMHFLLD